LVDSEVLAKQNVIATQCQLFHEMHQQLQVRAVKLRREKIAVALEQKVLVYNFVDLKLLHNIETLSNPTGLMVLSAAAENTVLACPGLKPGQASRTPPDCTCAST
jgi:hypothetical protein